MMMGRRHEGARRLLQTYQVMADPHEAGDLDKRLPHPPDSSAPKLGINNSSQSQQQQPFDSSMCLTILVLLAALFFMGFFSIYIRRFAHDSPVEISRRRRLRSRSPSPSYTYAAASPAAMRLCNARKGLDFSTIQSLPVLAYSSGFGKRPLVVDCPVCLTEFDEGEGVKMLPSCQHLFHPECIDTWLLYRASCPVCRASRIFAAAEQEERVGGEVAMQMEAAVAADGEGGVVAGAEDEMMRRCCSCSNLVVSERGGLQRTRSF